MSDLELRYAAVQPRLLTEEGADPDSGRIVTGYASVFNSHYPVKDVRGKEFMECVRTGAFSDCLASGPDIRCLLNHNCDLLLGRTKSGSLRCWQDQRGLAFQCTLPDTEQGRSVAFAIRRGDLDACSFGFRVRANGERWSNDNHGKPTRELLAVDVMDVSLATFPASDRTAGVQLRTEIPLRFDNSREKIRLRLLAAEM